MSVLLLEVSEVHTSNRFDGHAIRHAANQETIMQFGHRNAATVGLGHHPRKAAAKRRAAKRTVSRKKKSVKKAARKRAKKAKGRVKKTVRRAKKAARATARKATRRVKKAARRVAKKAKRPTRKK